MYKKLILVALLGIMVGCQNTVYTNRDTINDPTWPKPIENRNFETKVVTTKQDEIIVGMSYEDNIEYRIWQEDILRYIKDQQAMICFYRKNLVEPQCPESEEKK